MSIYAKSYARARSAIAALGDPIWKEFEHIDVATIKGFPDEDLSLVVTCGLSHFRLDFQIPSEAISFELSLVVPSQFASEDFSAVVREASRLLLDRYLANGCTPPRNVVWPSRALSVISSANGWRLSSVMFGFGIFTPTDSAMLHDDDFGTLCIAELICLTNEEAMLASDDCSAFISKATSGEIDLLDFSR